MKTALAVPAIACGLLACGSGDHSSASVSTAQAQWEVAAQPSLQIGLADGDSSYLFTRIAGAARLSDGRIVIADGPTDQIRVFTAEGKHQRTMGGKGGGPGEFEHNLTEIALAAGDTILAFQTFDVPWVSRFTADSGYIDQWKLDPRRVWRPGFNLENEFELMRDGSVVFQMDSMRNIKPGGGWQRRHMLTVLVDRFKRVDTLGWFPSPAKGVVFAQPVPLLTHHGGSLFIVDAERPMFWRYDIASGKLDSTTWSDGHRLVFSGAMKKAVLDNIARQFSNVPPSFRDQMLKSITLPDSTPYFRSVLPDTDGNFWIDERQTAADSAQGWTVRTSVGKAVGHVRVPPIRVLQVGGDFILGVHYDEDMIPRVLLYSITKTKH